MKRSNVYILRCKKVANAKKMGMRDKNMFFSPSPGKKPFSRTGDVGDKSEEKIVVPWLHKLGPTSLPINYNFGDNKKIKNNTINSAINIKLHKYNYIYLDKIFFLCIPPFLVYRGIFLEILTRVGKSKSIP